MRELLRKGLIFFARHLVVSHLLLIFAAQKDKAQVVSLQEHSGCSSARLEYSSGGASGRWFESSHPDRRKRKNLSVSFLRFVEDRILGENSVK